MTQQKLIRREIPDGKYDRRDEILRDVLNGKPTIVQNQKKSEQHTDDDDDDDEEKMPEETGDRLSHTSERDSRYKLIQTSPEEEVLQIHTNGKVALGEKIENTIRDPADI